MENGFLKMRNITITTPDPKTNKRTVVETKISGRGDPGYALTAGTTFASGHVIELTD